MAITVDILPKFDTTSFTKNVKLGIADGLIATALDLVSSVDVRYHLQQARIEINSLTKGSDDGT